ncbi:MAG: helix-turn-helix domain-containing protein [Clostridium sp.]
MKISSQYLGYIALKELTTYHYKTLLILVDKPQTQSMICDILGVHKQNLNKIMRELEQLGFVEVDRVEGRNKFYKAVLDLDRLQNTLPGQTKI